MLTNKTRTSRMGRFDKKGFRSRERQRDKQAEFGPPRKKVCRFCIDKIDSVDYKDIKRIERFVSERGKILPRKILGVCAKHERKLSEAIKRARYIGLLPYVKV